MNLFTRDNTNDGGGWDIRVSLLKQSAHYGYSQHYANFPDEIMPPLGVSSAAAPARASCTCKTSAGRRSTATCCSPATGAGAKSTATNCKPHGPTFDLKQEVFLKMPRATGMDMDGSGRLYVASWRGGEAVTIRRPERRLRRARHAQGLQAGAVPRSEEGRSPKI